MKNSVRYFTFDAWLRARHGKKVQKIPLDANSKCPNRDGKLSIGGCIFCNAIGSGSGLGQLPIPSQWAHWRKRFSASDRLKHTSLFLAYVQAFTNTYGPASRLRSIIDSLRSLPDLVGICIGTRPDCLDEEKLSIIAGSGYPEIWLELGAQTKFDATLKRINRGHTARQSAEAIKLAHSFGIRTCAHLMAGLPGETGHDFLQTVEWISGLPVDGVKLHSLYVCKNTPLQRDWLDKTYIPQTQAEYVELLAQALLILPSSMVIHRLTGDPAPGELAAPEWASQKGLTIRMLDMLLEKNDWWQGRGNDARDVNPWADTEWN